jgi:hypothetical protein
MVLHVVSRGVVSGKFLARQTWTLTSMTQNRNAVGPGRPRCGRRPCRNSIEEHILTMEPPGTAVRTAVSPGHARPWRLKLSVLFRRSYAFSYRRALISRAGRNHTAVSGLASAVTLTAAAKVQSPRDWRSGRWSASSKVNSPITVRFLQRS